MSQEPRTTRLLEKIAALPPEKQLVVADFVDYLLQRDDDHALRWATMRMSEAALSEAWENDEDSVYDSL